MHDYYSKIANVTRKFLQFIYYMNNIRKRNVWKQKIRIINKDYIYMHNKYLNDTYKLIGT